MPPLTESKKLLTRVSQRINITSFGSCNFCEGGPFTTEHGCSRHFDWGFQTSKAPHHGRRRKMRCDPLLLFFLIWLCLLRFSASYAALPPPNKTFATCAGTRNCSGGASTHSLFARRETDPSDRSSYRLRLTPHYGC